MMNSCLPIVVNGTNFTTDCTTEPSFAVGATILSPVLMFLAGVLGNILALSRLYKRRTDSRSTKFYNFITGLAWTDLIGILVTTPSVLASYVNGLKWVGGDIHCRFHGFAMTCFGIATPLIICAMAVERFLALKCVFFYSSKCRSGTERGCILVLWLIVILFGLLPLYGFGSFEKQYPGTWCFLDFHSHDLRTQLYAYIYAATNLVLIALITICNAYVVFTLFKTRFRRETQKQRCESLQTSNFTTTEQEGLVSNKYPAKRRSTNVEIQMSVLLCSLTVVFTICWAPLMIQILKTMVTGKPNFIMDLAAVRLASINQTLDPWLYILLRRSLCTRIWSAVTRIKVNCITIIGHQLNSENTQINTNKEEHDRNANNHNTDENCANILEPNVNQRALDQPDVMKSVTNSNSTSSPLPDVTNTGNNKDCNDSGYVCHFHFGKTEVENNDDAGIYVKIFYLRPESSFISSKSIQDTCNRKVKNNFQITEGSEGEERIVGSANNTNNKDSDRCSPVRPSDNNSNETFLSQDYNLTFHSETLGDVSKDVNLHESLRRTKSNTTP